MHPILSIGPVPEPSQDRAATQGVAAPDPDPESPGTAQTSEPSFAAVFDEGTAKTRAAVVIAEVAPEPNPPTEGQGAEPDVPPRPETEPRRATPLPNTASEGDPPSSLSGTVTPVANRATASPASLDVAAAPAASETPQPPPPSRIRAEQRSEAEQLASRRTHNIAHDAPPAPSTALPAKRDGRPEPRLLTQASSRPAAGGGAGAGATARDVVPPGTASDRKIAVGRDAAGPVPTPVNSGMVQQAQSVTDVTSISAAMLGEAAPRVSKREARGLSEQPTGLIRTPMPSAGQVTGIAPPGAAAPPAVSKEGDIAFKPDRLSALSAFTDADTALLSRGDAPAGSPTIGTSSIPMRMEIHHHVARQVADALQHMPSRPVEISLSPEELGRVRLAMAHAETGIMVSVLAERPETLELMRRHIQSLQAAFEAIGYADISFSFDAEGAAADPERAEKSMSDTSSEPAGDAALENVPSVAHHLTLRTGSTSGVDIRL